MSTEEKTEIQQSLFDEETRLEIKERFQRLHKSAFRVAFDFLGQHFPPENTDKYWLQTCADVGVASAENLTNPLCQELLGAVLMYLSDHVKENENG